jgi:hypothetical protein
MLANNFDVKMLEPDGSPNNDANRPRAAFRYPPFRANSPRTNGIASR